MRNSFFEVFKIDKLGKRVFVRVLFVILLSINLFIIFHPIGDTNFDAYFSWMESMMSNPQMIETFNIEDMPLTEGNYLFLGVAFLVAMLDISSSWLYTGLFIRKYRQKNNPKKAISLSKLIFRLIVLIIFSVIIITIFSVFVLYLGIFFIIIFPYIIMFPACYLSGDYSLFGSFGGMVKVTNGYYLLNSRNLSLLLCTLFLGQIVVQLLSGISEATSAAMTPFLNIFLLLSLGRYIGIIYIRMLQLPRGIRILVTQQMNNDVRDDDISEN